MLCRVSSQNDVLVLSAADVASLLDVDLAIASQQRAFEALGRGEAALPPRLLIDGAEDSVSFCYAARLGPAEGAVCKFGSVNPANSRQGLPTVSALVAVLDGADGRPVAIMDGTSVTTLRTSAASAVAVRALATAGSDSLTVLGSGVQAAAHVRAIARVLRLRRVHVWSVHRSHAQTLADDLDLGPDTEVVVASSGEEAVRAGDVVVACTTSVVPVLETAWLRPGATVVSIGSFAADRCEVPQDLLTTASVVVVDDVETALEHAGPVVSAVAAGVVTADRLVPLGAVVIGARPGRTAPSDIVYFNSVGIGVQDAAAALAVLDAARAGRRGQTVTL